MARLPLFEAAGIKVVLNLYSSPGGFAQKDKKFSQRVFQEQWAQDSFIAAWETIARRYNGNKSIYGYDLLNEPAMAVVPKSSCSRLE